MRFLSPLPSLALILMARSLEAAPVTDWVLLFDGDNDAAIAAGTENTAGPEVTDAHRTSPAANFPTVTLSDGDSITLTGTVSFSEVLSDGQFRFGLFDGDNPVTEGDGVGYEGFYAEAPIPNGTADINSTNGNGSPHPFTSGSSTALAAMSNPGSTPSANTSLDFSLTLTRDGASVNIEAAVTDGASYTSTSTLTGQTPVPANFTYDSVAFLTGGGFAEPMTATYSNIDVSASGTSNPDSDGDGIADAMEQIIIDADPGDAVDGLDDVMGTGAAPAVTDFDGDGADDGEEISEGTDPLDEDSDNDGFHDGAETNDGTFNSYDYVTNTGDTGTDPLDPDTDGDGLDDGVENGTGTFVNADMTGTDPLDPDSDGDNTSDGAEVDNGTDPNDPESNSSGRLLGIDFNRNDALSSPSQSLFRVISGSQTQSANAPSYVKTVGAHQVTVSEPGGSNLEFRGGNTDSTRAIPGGDTSLSFLVADFVGTRKRAINISISDLPAGTYSFRSWHLEPTTGATLGFAQGSTTTTPNLIEARHGGVVKDTVEPTALGSSGLNTTFINDGQIPTIEFPLVHDGSPLLTIELRSTLPGTGDSFLFLNGFELFQANP